MKGSFIKVQVFFLKNFFFKIIIIIQSNQTKNCSIFKKKEEEEESMYQIPYYEVPREEEDYRFVQSFSLDSQEEEALEFFNEFGFVVFNGILNEDECQKSVDELFQLCEMKPSDPSTWNHWPKNGMERYGTPTQAPLFSPQLLRNRQNPRLHRAFSLLLKTQDLLINHDRACLMRPVAENPSWATSLSLHLDFNPWNYLSSDHSQLEKAFNELDYSTLAQFIAENNQIVFSPDETPLQGGFNFLDNFEEDGGFIIIPGFNHHFEEWARANSNLSKSNHFSFFIYFYFFFHFIYFSFIFFFFLRKFMFSFLSFFLFFLFYSPRDFLFITNKKIK